MPHHCNVTEMLDELRFRHAHAIAEVERASNICVRSQIAGADARLKMAS